MNHPVHIWKVLQEESEVWDEEVQEEKKIKQGKD